MIRSTTVGIPRFRTPPFGLGISTLRTGLGLYFRLRICSRIFSQFSVRCCFTSSVLIPSTPPAPLFATTRLYASIMLFLESISSKSCDIDCLLSFFRSHILSPISCKPFTPLRLRYLGSRRTWIFAFRVPFDYWIVRSFAPLPLQELHHYYDLGWLLTVRCYCGFRRPRDLTG